MAKRFRCVEVKRDHLLRFRVTDSEQKLIEQKAMDCGMTVSDYLRQRALEKKIRSKELASVINELRDLNQLQKDLYHSSDKKHQAFFGQSYMRVLKAAADAIERIPAKAFMDF